MYSGVWSNSVDQESITKDPKTSSGDRMVYLSKEMCQLLKAWRKECEWDRAQTANETVTIMIICFAS